MKPVDQFGNAYPDIGNVLRWLPFRKAISRWLSGSNLAKYVNIALFNLPKVMPDDFALDITGRRNEGKQGIHYEINFNPPILTAAYRTYDLKKTGEKEALTSSENFTTQISSENGLAFYRTLRNVGLIHFETDDQVHVSYEPVWYYATNYEFQVEGRRFHLRHSTDYPPLKIWEEEVLTLDQFINNFVSMHRSGLPLRVKYQPSPASDN